MNKRNLDKGKSGVSQILKRTKKPPPRQIITERIPVTRLERDIYVTRKCNAKYVVKKICSLLMGEFKAFGKGKRSLDELTDLLKFKVNQNYGLKDGQSGLVAVDKTVDIIQDRILGDSGGINEHKKTVKLDATDNQVRVHALGMAISKCIKICRMVEQQSGGLVTIIDVESSTVPLQDEILVSTNNAVIPEIEIQEQSRDTSSLHVLLQLGTP
ncbi:hypothetical protein MP228_005710 [Amoeboaphelidium protococcarum]|nr:hypothetical protein MP228_005710 [Amoeboaphelidium protococcarum]